MGNTKGSESETKKNGSDVSCCGGVGADPSEGEV